MSGDVIARDYVARASRYLAHAEEALHDNELSDSIRFAQEATELSLKAALRWAGIEYPRAHNVVQVLLQHAARFPAWFRKDWEKLSPLWEELARQRGASLYGLEVGGKPATEIFTDKDEVERLLLSARKAQATAERLLRSGATKT